LPGRNRSIACVALVDSVGGNKKAGLINKTARARVRIEHRLNFTPQLVVAIATVLQKRWPSVWRELERLLEDRFDLFPALRRHVLLRGGDFPV